MQVVHGAWRSAWESVWFALLVVWSEALLLAVVSAVECCSNLLFPPQFFSHLKPKFASITKNMKVTTSAEEILGKLSLETFKSPFFVHSAPRFCGFRRFIWRNNKSWEMVFTSKHYEQGWCSSKLRIRTNLACLRPSYMAFSVVQLLSHQLGHNYQDLFVTQQHISIGHAIFSCPLRNNFPSSIHLLVLLHCTMTWSFFLSLSVV